REETDLFRIAQEGLYNAIKYSKAAALEVELQVNNSHLLLIVRDDGRGFAEDSGNKGGLGLRTMRYRAEKLGGELIVESRPALGTEIRCKIPLINGCSPFPAGRRDSEVPSTKIQVPGKHQIPILN